MRGLIRRGAQTAITATIASVLACPYASAQTPTYTIGSSSIAGFTLIDDVDGDGLADILLCTSNQLIAFSGKDCSQIYATIISATASAVAAIGDVNLDGLHDCAVSVGNTVQVRSGFDGAILYTVVGPNGSAFGSAVAGLADVNGDGRADFIVGAPTTAPGGSVSIHSGLDGTELARFDSSVPTEGLGFSVACGGDIDGDGTLDAIVGAPFHQQTDRVVVVSGSDASVLLEVQGDPFSRLFGFRVSGGHDLNGDSVPDFAVADPQSQKGYPGAGRVTVFSGVDGSPFWSLVGPQAGVSFGIAVTMGGDYDDDGFADLLVGSQELSSGSTMGRVRVYSGARRSFLKFLEVYVGGFGNAVAEPGDTNGDSRADVLVASTSSLHLALGQSQAAAYSVVGTPAAKLGSAIGRVGDLNSDGIEDFIAGAPASGAGLASVFSGFDGATLFQLNGDSMFDQFGLSVAGLGDLTGDGYPEVIVGAPGDSNYLPLAGSARVYSGQSGLIVYFLNGVSSDEAFGSVVSEVGDVNNDGVGDFAVSALRNDISGTDGGAVYVFSGANGSQVHLLYNVVQPKNNAQFGFSVLGLDDLNGDGHADFAVGSPGWSGSGRVDVFSGFDASVIYFLTIQGNYEFGFSLSGGGDVNNDGQADFLVGAPSSSNQGQVFAYTAADGSLAGQFGPGPSISSQGALSFGQAVSAAGDVDGDGYDDFWVAAPASDIPWTDAGAVYLVSGQTGAFLDARHGGPGEMLGDALLGDVDLNGDGVADPIISVASASRIEVFLRGATPPSVYCTAKLNSKGCVPAISVTGMPSLTTGNNVMVMADDVLGAKSGLLIWSRMHDATPFGFGFLCVSNPIKRAGVQVSSGSSTSCDGTYSFHFSQEFMISQGLLPGDDVRAQFWSRDQGYAPPNNFGLTDAVAFTVYP